MTTLQLFDPLRLDSIVPDPERGYLEAWLREVVARYPDRYRLV